MSINPVTIIATLYFLGVVIGTAYTTLAEISYLRAASDGDVDAHERKYLRRLYRGMHFGMSLVLCTAIALIVLEYLVAGAPQDVLAAPFWAAQTITAAMVYFGWSLEKRQTPWWVASAGIVVGWWMLAFLDLGYFNNYPYVAIIMMYILLLFIIAGIVGYIRLWTWKPLHPQKG